MATKSRRWSRMAFFTASSSPRGALGRRASGRCCLSCLRSPTPHQTSGSSAGRPLRVRSAYSRSLRYSSGRLRSRARLARLERTSPRARVCRPGVPPAAFRFGGSWVSHGTSGRNAGLLEGRAGRTPVERQQQLREQLLARLAGRHQRGGPAAGLGAEEGRVGVLRCGSRPRARRTRGRSPRTTARRPARGSRGRGSAPRRTGGARCSGTRPARGSARRCAASGGSAAPGRHRGVAACG